MFADTVLEQAYSHLDRVLASWGNMACTSWICVTCPFPQKILASYFATEICSSPTQWLFVHLLYWVNYCWNAELHNVYRNLHRLPTYEGMSLFYNFSSWMLWILCKLTFPTRVSKGWIDFVVIKLTACAFLGGRRRETCNKSLVFWHCSGKDAFTLLCDLPYSGVLNMGFKYRMKTLDLGNQNKSNRENNFCLITMIFWNVIFSLSSNGNCL